MIRSAVPSDIDDVVGLALSSGLFAPEDVSIVHALMVAYFARAAGGGHRCVLDVQGTPRGVAYYQPAPATDRAWYLTMIGVRGQDQGHGRGAELLRHVEEDLRSTGQRLLLVETSGTPEFARTRAFYAANGYTEEARVRDFYADRDDMVLFHKVLAASPTR